MHWSCIGHEREKEYLGRLLNEGRLAHAYLFAGPDGVGKRMVAEDVIRGLVGEGPTLEVLRLAPESDDDGRLHEIPIASVRAMKSWLVLRPAGAAKAVLIDDADRLGGEAANTLLKALEEPPAYARFFLITSRPGSIPETVRSRCELVRFRELEESDFTAAIRAVKLDDDDRNLLGLVAAGRPGAALKLAGQRRLPAVASAIASLQKALAGGVAERFALAREVAASPDAEDVVGWWTGFIHQRLKEKPSLARVARGLMDAGEAFAEVGVNRRLALERFFLELG